MNWILTAHATATFFMVGLIWFVQIVHYPLLDRVGESGFPQYEAANCRLTAGIVGFPMLVELATAPMLFWYPAPAETAKLFWIGDALLLLIWLSTLLFQMPQHRALSLGFHPATHRRLVATNWVRTVAWSLRGLILLAVVAARLK